MYKVTLYRDINDQKGTVIHYPNRSDIKLTAGNIAQGINVVDTFTFTMNMDCPVYTSVRSLWSLVTVYNTKTNKFEFDGYVLRQSAEYDEDGSYHKTVTCVSGFNYLKQSKQKFGEFHNMTPKSFLQELISVHNGQVETYKQFQLGTVNVTNSTDNVYRFTDQEATTFDTIFEKLETRLGGELRVRHEFGKWYLDWMVSIGSTKQTEIRVGRNLKSASRDEDTESVVTRWMVYGTSLDYKAGVIDNFDTLANGTRVAVIEINDQDETVPVNVNLLPSGADVGSYIFIAGESPNYIIELRGANDVASETATPRLTIAAVNNGKDYIDDVTGIAQFGIQVGHVTFDDVTNKSTLLSKGIAHLQAYKQVAISNVISALDLSLIGKDIDSYEVYNSYPLNNPGIAEKETVRIIEKRIDINNPQSSTLTIGDKFQTASQYQASTNKNNKIVKALQTTVQNQSSSIATLKTSNTAITKSYEAMQVSYNSLATSLEIDSETGTSLALVNLKTAIDNLGEDIVSYGLVTTTTDGLMISTDKVKLDNLKEYTEATHLQSGLFSASDKTKLDLVTVTSPVDLNDLVARLTALEQPE